MIPETTLQVESGTRARIRLKVDEFMQYTRVLGCETDRARSLLIDVDPKTIWRARKGEPVSDELVAKTIVALQRRRADLARYNLTASFDALFEVIEA